ncbi:MAG: hypothetical protein JNK21_08535 [Rhodospirillaceae bacterium]|nr:hypothetical protein [Rhodospirillaceae bacterium]
MPSDLSSTSDTLIAPSNADRDSLHVLPLCIIPVQTPALKAARMIKNAQLDSVVEVYRDREIGSGQVEIEKLPQKFNWPASPTHPDFTLLRKLAVMPSYDVYSLRVQLRDHGIEVNQSDALKLSPEKTKELSGLMRNFTRPLLMQIYGAEAGGIETFEDVLRLFRDPDKEKARQRLMTMSETLGIDIFTIPKFLEDYADIFLSLSYYRQCLDRITPTVYEFIDGLKDIKKNYQMRSNASLMATCEEMRGTFTDLLVSVTGRLESFERSTKDMWTGLSAERFRQLERFIKAYHTTMGGILCALTVKMDAWAEAFPRANVGGPVRRADFIMTDMRHGLSMIRKICKSAPSLSDISQAA